MSQGPGVVGLPTALLLLCIPGCLTLSCSSPVAGAVGESLSVQCRYEQKYKTFKKYWCRQPCLPLWHQIVETRGSDGEVRSGRVSITDHSGNLTFTVTMENLTADDEGKYRCGIATILKEEGLHGLLPDLFFQVQVFVSSASSIENSARAPGSPRSSRPSQRQGVVPSKSRVPAACRWRRAQFRRLFPGVDFCLSSYLALLLSSPLCPPVSTGPQHKDRSL
ncbi:protein CD300H-like isoform X1 [Nycticebus coucang]|uniref:protein CD300H-like isoform X1 n=1 Tax=Nycticebus coucang TaxID=9470 RepID=UPI00234C2B3E|nr:protein CD300H-like isoform X1 [Nycticebus coucang]XP_053423690.1 protein CD300H-like isoform X1 [Nycticebus coucang]